MFKKAITLVFLMIVFRVLHGQEITQHNVDSLRRSLTNEHIDSNRVKIFIALAQYVVAKPGEYKYDMDSAMVYINQAKKLNSFLKGIDLTGHIDLVTAQIYFESGKINDAITKVQDAIKILNDEKNHRLLGRAYEILSYCYSSDSQYEKKVEAIKNAQRIYEAARLTRQYADLTKSLAELYWNKEDDARGLYELNHAYNAYKKIKYSNLTPVYVLFGDLYHALGEYDQTLKYQLLALKSCEALHNRHTQQYCDISNSIGITYLELKDLRAIAYFKLALEAAVAIHNLSNIYIIYINVAMSYRRAHNPNQAIRVIRELEKKYPPAPDTTILRYSIPGIWISIYTELKEVDKATPFIKQYKAALKRRDLASVYIRNGYIVLGNYYTAIKQYNVAAADFQTALLLGEKAGDRFHQSSTYEHWFSLDTARKDYYSAVSHLLSYNKLNDTLLSENKRKQIEQLRIAYETSQKEDNIKVLQAQNKLHEHEIVQSAQYRKFYAVGIILLLLLLGIGLNRYMIKQRHNTQLEVKQKEISTKNVALERLLKDNEWLLREVHHRVKNNLQIVMSLLSSQSVYLKDEAALTAVMESQNRVQAMSLIHQKLYKNNNISNIYIPDYINDLVDYLKDSYRIENSISIERNIAPIYMDVSQAVPLGLILNEVVTNSIKHGFSQMSGGHIIITLKEVPDDQIELIVEDNGQGFDRPYELGFAKSFGLKLIHGLVADLDGVINIFGDQGTKVHVKFRKAPRSLAV